MKTVILIVDDAEIILLGWRYALRSAGYEVLTASNGSEAIRMAKQYEPDIVITDLVMPDMNGVEVCKKIREICPGSQVILISGHPDEIEKHQRDFILAGGRKEIFRKPLLKTDVINAIETIERERA